MAVVQLFPSCNESMLSRKSTGRRLPCIKEAYAVSFLIKRSFTRSKIYFNHRETQNVFSVPLMPTTNRKKDRETINKDPCDACKGRKKKVIQMSYTLLHSHESDAQTYFRYCSVR